jgi:hypothetical protein
MGITIHYRLGQEKKYVPAMIDRVEALGKTIKTEQADKVGIDFKIVREHPYRLHFEIGGCEWLELGFGSMKHWQEEAAKNKSGWSYENETLKDQFPSKVLDDGSTMFASGFCKTQFASSVVEHKWVCDILRFCASYCESVYVHDEGDYYHSGKIDDARESIAANGKMIDSIGSMLDKSFEGADIIKGGETAIKSKVVRGIAKEWIIWSNEHDGWWGPNHSGYVKDRAEAGRYSFEEAKRIVNDANRFVDGTPNEAMIFDETL